MTSNTSYVRGIFKNEIKNRFLCSVVIDGNEVVCYVPSSCRLSNFLDMTDREVVLRPVSSPTSRTKYALYAIKYGKTYIPINLSNSNRIVENQLKRRFFSFLGKRKNIEREKGIDGYKCDLFIKDTNTIIEIKSYLSFQKEATFPSVYSERIIKQLQYISDLLDKGYKVCFMLISLCNKSKCVKLNSEYTDFYELFNTCIDKGMAVCGFSVKLVDMEPTISGPIDVHF